MNISPELAVAAEKLFAKVKTPVTVGTHQVDQVVTVRVKAEVKKLADETYTPTVSVPYKAVIGVLLHRMGFQREKAAEMLTEALRDALNLGANTNEEIKSLMSDVDDCMKRVEDMTSTLPPQHRVGRCSVKGELEIISVDAGSVDQAL